jgi:hypothetical protein
MVLFSAAFSQWLFEHLGLFILPPLTHLRLLDCVEVQRSIRHLIRRSYLIPPSAKLVMHRLAHAFVSVLSVRLSLDLSECKVVLTF